MKIGFLMHKVILALLAMVGAAATSYAQQEQDMSGGYPNHRVLVAYFSATGTTARVAGKVAQATGGELYAITPQSLIRAQTSIGTTSSRAVR